MILLVFISLVSPDARGNKMSRNHVAVSHAIYSNTTPLVETSFTSQSVYPPPIDPSTCPSRRPTMTHPIKPSHPSISPIVKSSKQLISPSYKLYEQNSLLSKPTKSPVETPSPFPTNIPTSTTTFPVSSMPTCPIFVQTYFVTSNGSTVYPTKCLTRNPCSSPTICPTASPSYVPLVRQTLTPAITTLALPSSRLNLPSTTASSATIQLTGSSSLLPAIKHLTPSCTIQSSTPNTIHSIYPISPTDCPSSCPSQKPTTQPPSSLTPSSFSTIYQRTLVPSTASSPASFSDKLVNLISSQIELSALVFAIIIIFIFLCCLRMCSKFHGLNSEPVEASVEIPSSGENTEGACYIMSNDIIIIPNDLSPEILENFTGYGSSTPPPTFIQENSQRTTLSMPAIKLSSTASPSKSSRANTAIRDTFYTSTIDSVITVHATPITDSTTAVPKSTETPENRLSLNLSSIDIEEPENRNSPPNSTAITITNNSLNIALNQSVNTTRSSMHLVTSPSRAETLLGRYSHGRRDRTSSHASRTVHFRSANENSNNSAVANVESENAGDSPRSNDFANISPSDALAGVNVTNSDQASTSASIYFAEASESSSEQERWEQGKITISRPSYMPQSLAEASSAMLNNNCDDDGEEYQEEEYDDADLEPLQTPILMDPGISQHEEGTYAYWQQQLDEQVLDGEISVDDEGSTLDVEDVHVFIPGIDLFTEDEDDGD